MLEDGSIDYSTLPTQYLEVRLFPLIHTYTNFPCSRIPTHP